MTTLRTQLRSGSGTEGEDCVAVSGCNALLLLSHGAVGPRVVKPPQDPQSVASWVRFLRRLARRPTGPLLVHGDGYEALSSTEVKAAFRSAGLRPPTVEYRYGMPFGELRAWLANRPDRCAILPVDYGVARRDGCPMGSTTFSGGHAIVVTDVRRKRVRRGHRYVRRWFATVGDPLMDGRRKPGSLTRYPKGWLTTRLYRYRRAAGAFGSAPDGTPRPIGFGRTVCILLERG